MIFFHLSKIRCRFVCHCHGHGTAGWGRTRACDPTQCTFVLITSTCDRRHRWEVLRWSGRGFSCRLEAACEEMEPLDVALQARTQGLCLVRQFFPSCPRGMSGRHGARRRGCSHNSDGVSAAGNKVGRPPYQQWARHGAVGTPQVRRHLAICSSSWSQCVVPHPLSDG